MQSKYRLLSVIALVLLSAVYITSLFKLSQSTKVPTNSLLEAHFNSLDGKEIGLNAWKNKVIVLNFWATWCPPCREEMPELSKMQDQYKNQNLVIVGLSTDDLETTKTFIQTNPVSYPVLAGDMQAMNFAESLGNNQGVLPYTVIIDQNGHVVKTFLGRVNQALLEKTVKPLLKNATSLN
jgi:peroxiredoxin